MWQNLEKTLKCIVGKFFWVLVCTFFFSECQEVILYKVSTVKKQRNVLNVLFNRIYTEERVTICKGEERNEDKNIKSL